MDYNVIYDFCKVRNNGTAMKNGVDEYPPRVKFIINLLEKLNLDYEIDSFMYSNKTKLHNIYLKGSSDKWVMAHHDVCNHTIDNANDNSASVINAIGLKTIRPDINIALVDGEEPPLMGAGSKHFANRILENKLNVKWVLNLELTGAGGENFFIGNYNTPLTKSIENKFGCAVMNVPFNDATVLINSDAKVNAALINPCPLKSGQFVVKQVGIANDVLNSFGSNHDDDDDDDFDGGDDVLDGGDDVLDGGDDVLDGGFYGGDDNFFFDNNYERIKEGDILSKSEKEILENNLKYSNYNPKDKTEELIIEEEPIVVEKGNMPTLNQMDTSILYRCHTKDDTVDHIRPDEMKSFVEKVLTVICEL